MFIFSCHFSVEDQSGMVHRGPVKNRSCTDIFCLIIFIAFLVGWAIIGFYGKENKKSDRCCVRTNLKVTYQNFKVLSRHPVIRSTFYPENQILLLLLLLLLVSPVCWS